MIQRGKQIRLSLVGGLPARRAGNMRVMHGAIVRACAWRVVDCSRASKSWRTVRIREQGRYGAKPIPKPSGQFWAGLPSWGQSPATLNDDCAWVPDGDVDALVASLREYIRR